MSQYGRCGSESTGPLSEGGCEPTSSFTSGPTREQLSNTGSMQATLAGRDSGNSTPIRGGGGYPPSSVKGTASTQSFSTSPQGSHVDPNQTRANTAPTGSSPSTSPSQPKKQVSFSDRFSSFLKDLLGPKRPAQSQGTSAASTTASTQSATSPQATVDSTKRPNDGRRSLLHQVAQIKQAVPGNGCGAGSKTPLLSQVADLLEKEREKIRLRSYVSNWLTASSPSTATTKSQSNGIHTGSLLASAPQAAERANSAEKPQGAGATNQAPSVAPVKMPPLIFSAKTAPAPNPNSNPSTAATATSAVAPNPNPTGTGHPQSNQGNASMSVPPSENASFQSVPQGSFYLDRPVDGAGAGGRAHSTPQAEGHNHRPPHLSFDSRSEAMESEASGAVKDTGSVFSLTEEEKVKQQLTSKILDFYGRYDPLHVPSDEAISDLLDSGIPENVLFHYLQKKYGLLPPALHASPSTHGSVNKRSSASLEEAHHSKTLSGVEAAPLGASPTAVAPSGSTIHHESSTLGLDSLVDWKPEWTELLKPFNPQSTFQAFATVKSSGSGPIAERFRSLPADYPRNSEGHLCQTFLFEGKKVVLNHSTKKAIFPAPEEDCGNMFGLPSTILSRDSPPLPDANISLPYAVPKQWKRRKDSRSTTAFAFLREKRKEAAVAAPQPAQQPGAPAAPAAGPTNATRSTSGANQSTTTGSGPMAAPPQPAAEVKPIPAPERDDGEWSESESEQLGATAFQMFSIADCG